METGFAFWYVSFIDKNAVEQIVEVNLFLLT